MIHRQGSIGAVLRAFRSPLNFTLAKLLNELTKLVEGGWTVIKKPSILGERGEPALHLKPPSGVRLNLSVIPEDLALASAVASCILCKRDNDSRLPTFEMAIKLGLPSSEALVLEQVQYGVVIDEPSRVLYEKIETALGLTEQELII
jgi:hypothetical protein